MTDLATTDHLFFERAGMDRDRITRIVEETLNGADDGELFLEYRQSEGLAFDDGRLKSASFDTAQGFGLRAIAAEAVGYSHASELSEDAIRRASETVRAVRSVVHGFATLEAEGGFGLPLDCDESFRRMIDMLIRAWG